MRMDRVDTARDEPNELERLRDEARYRRERASEGADARLRRA